MAFETKTDWFALSGTNLEITDSTEGKSASVANATDEGGSIVATEVYGELLAPSCTYLPKASVSWSTLKLGDLSEGPGHIDNICIKSISITLAKGEAPKMVVSGEQVDGVPEVTQFNVYAFPTFTMPVVHAASDLLTCATISGTGCYLQSNTVTGTCNVSKATKDGTVISHDVSEGKIECQLSIIQTGATSPTVAAATGWKITSPLTRSETDANFPTWSVTLTKALVKSTHQHGT